MNGEAKYLLLDDHVGWHRVGDPTPEPELRSGLTVIQRERARSLILEPLPGPATTLPGGVALAAAFACPSALALSPPGCTSRVFVVDAGRAAVGELDWGGDPSGPGCAQAQFKVLPTIGGRGSLPRQLAEPRGIAVLSHGALVVADSGNHRIQIFSWPTLALLQVWGALDSLGRPHPGALPRQFRWPWAVAIARHPGGLDTVWVVDRGNRRLQHLQADGTFLGELGRGLLHDPIRMALGPAGEVAVVDRRGSRKAVVILFTAAGTVHEIAVPADPRSLTFDRDGRLYVGDTVGFVHVYVADPTTAWGLRRIGASPTELGGPVLDLVTLPGPGPTDVGLLAIARSAADELTPGVPRQGVWQLPLGAGAGYLRQGTLITRALDSGLERCVWHRVALAATVPPGTSLEIETTTAETHEPGPMAPSDWRRGALVGDADPDCLVPSAPGRYLWLRLTWRGDGRNTPAVDRIKVFFPRVGYLQYLPAVFQEDEESRLFLERFLAIFQTEFDDLDARLDRLWQLFDPDTVPAKDLRWLAGWLALTLEPELSESAQRHLLKTAFRAYLERGTVRGMERAIREHAAVPAAKILEHFRLRRWPWLNVAAPLNRSARLFSRDFYQRLQLGTYSQVGQFQVRSEPEPGLEPVDWEAHRFSVFFPADPYRSADTEQRVAAVVAREKPAHTQATLCPILPRLRVGVQATVGVDTVVGGISHLVLNHLATLSYDTILAGSPLARQVQAHGQTARPRAGFSTRLL